LAHDQVEELGRENERLREMLQLLGEENKSLRRDVHSVEKKVETVTSNYKDYIVQQDVEISRLLGESSEQKKRLQEQTIDFSRELKDLKNKQLVKAPSISDSEVQGEWKALDFEVRQFVAKYLQDPLDQISVQRLGQLEYFKWLPEMTKTLGSPFLCNIALRSWIWHFLCFRIFDTQSGFWSGDMGKASNVLNDQVIGTF
jgi:hypothetical protein